MTSLAHISIPIFDEFRLSLSQIIVHTMYIVQEAPCCPVSENALGSSGLRWNAQIQETTGQ